MVDPESFLRRVRAIDWSHYEAPCGYSTAEIPGLLARLTTPEPAVAVTAAKRLWTVICHQHNVASSAVPALPFLLEVLDHASDDLAIELLDIIYGFASYASTKPPDSSQHWWSSPSLISNPPRTRADWETQVIEILAPEVPRFQRLVSSTNEDVSSFSQLILESLNHNTSE